MISKQELTKISLVSSAMILMLVNIVGAAPFAYVPNSMDNTTTIFDTATNTVVTTVPVGHGPFGSAVSCTNAYVTNADDYTVTVIDTKTNVPIAIVPVGALPLGIAVTPDGKQVYVANDLDNTTSVIDTCTNTVTATVPVGGYPFGVAVTPDGTKTYVTNVHDGTVSVIDTATNKVTTTVPVGSTPRGVVVSPDGTNVYVANSGTYTYNSTTQITSSNADGTISVINAANNMVSATVPLYCEPVGITISPDGKQVYFTDDFYWGVGVMDTATNTVTAAVYLVNMPYGISVAPDGSEVYVAMPNNDYGATAIVDVINAANNREEGAVYVGRYPYSLGQFIQPAGCCPECPYKKPHKPCEITLITDPSTQSVDLLKFPVGDDYMSFPLGKLGKH